MYSAALPSHLRWQHEAYCSSTTATRQLPQYELCTSSKRWCVHERLWAASKIARKATSSSSSAGVAMCALQLVGALGEL